MKRWAWVVVAGLLVVAPGLVGAEQTRIKYELSGVVDVVVPVSFSSPVYSPSAPGPFALGSMITFQFDSSNSHPIVSGDVTILTFVQSNGLGIPGLATGANVFQLFQPGGITGGHLHAGSVATGPGVAVSQPNTGFVHCTATPAACYVLLGIPSFYQSFPLPRATRTNIPFGQPVPFPFPPEAATTVIGGWFFQPSLFGTVVGVRPFCTAFTGAPGASLCEGVQGIVSLVGTEVGRTKIAPEPAPLPLLALAAIGAALAPLSRRLRRA